MGGDSALKCSAKYRAVKITGGSIETVSPISPAMLSFQKNIWKFNIYTIYISGYISQTMQRNIWHSSVSMDYGWQFIVWIITAIYILYNEKIEKKI